MTSVEDAFLVEQPYRPAHPLGEGSFVAIESTYLGDAQQVQHQWSTTSFTQR